ncbi:NIF3-like protein 1 [Vairimorpha necatrix]|uniref:NIF3-like protein 1 n=1 Tax=Vairimorpha necatrix TaxID=6039 RepID=A0AAX4J998_9MICR
MNIHDLQDRVAQIFPLSEGLDWDNIGVLVDTGSLSSNVLLTVDISDLVIDECIRKNIKHIISYHPLIFSGIKKIQRDDLLLRCIQNDINVFSPHTSWDREMNEYLFELLKGLSLQEVIETLKREGNMEYLRIAKNTDKFSKLVVVVGSAFKYHDHVDSLIITGEMAHHCILHSLRKNNIVILLEHSNSERMTLKHMKSKLEGVLKECTLFISEEDKGPLQIIL